MWRWNARLRRWATGRPRAVRRLARRFPPGCELCGAGCKPVFVVSYADDGRLGVSLTNPNVDYEGAMKSRMYVKAPTLRQISGAETVEVIQR